MSTREPENRMYAYALYAAALLTLIFNLMLHSAPVAAFTAVLLAASVLYFNSGHIINNLLIKHSWVIEESSGYRLNPNLYSAVKSIGNVYKSVSAAQIVPENATIANANLGSLLEKIEIPFEFSVESRNVDPRTFMEALETKRRMKEIAIAKADPKQYDKINGLKRQLDVLKEEIRSISNSKPREIRVIVKAYAEESEENAAAKQSWNSIEQLAGMFSGAIGSEYDILKGEELTEVCG